MQGMVEHRSQSQKFLGHSTIKMTADVYTHTSAESEREAALAVERAIYGDLFPAVPNLRPGTTLHNKRGIEFVCSRLVSRSKKGASRFFLSAPMVAGVGFEPTTSGL